MKSSDMNALGESGGKKRTQSVEEETSLNGEFLEAEQVNMKRLACINKEWKSDFDELAELNKKFDDLPNPVDNETIFKFVNKVGSVLNKNEKNSSEEEKESFEVEGETSDLSTQIIDGETSLQCFKVEKVNFKNLKKINKEFQDLPASEKNSYEKIMQFKNNIKKLMGLKEEKYSTENESKNFFKLMKTVMEID